MCVIHKNVKLMIHPVLSNDTYNTKTTSKSVLMSLSRLAGVGNVCFNSLSPFLSIVHILSFEAISFQILFYAFFSRFPWSTFFLFPVILSTITSPIFELMSPRMTLSYNRIKQSHPTYHPDHTTVHPKRSCVNCNSKFPCFTTVQQN